MKRVLATLAVATMMASVPTAALAGKPDKSGNNNGDCSPRGANKGGTCNVTIIEGDGDGDGKVEYRCYAPTGGFIVVSAANCTNLLNHNLVIVDL